MAGEGGKGSLRYPDYLQVKELLALQRPLSSHHDETLFIVVHQVFELWFKLMLHDLDGGLKAMALDDPRTALRLVWRAAVTLNRVIDQIDVLERMSTLEFLEFRGDLEGASGFQSAQFREVEALLGLHEHDRVKVALAGGRAGLDAYRDLLTAEERERIERRQSAPSLEQSFLALVVRRVKTAHDDRVFLVDLPDLLEGADATGARLVLAGLEPLAHVQDREVIAPLEARLQALALWGGLVESEREALGQALGRAAVLDALRKLQRAPDDPAVEFELKLIDEESERKRTVGWSDVAAQLGGAGIDAPRIPAIAAALVARARLREVYRRAAHRTGVGDVYDLFQLAEAMVDLSEATSMFRMRHVKMVERMIGRRRGTGGSPGVAYLQETLRYQAFPELLRVRTVL